MPKPDHRPFSSRQRAPALSITRLLAAALITLGAGSAPAQPMLLPVAQTPLQPIGLVKTLRGAATVELDGQRYTVQLGTPVYAHSQFVTGPGSSLGLVFRDQTVVAIGPDSQLGIDEYLYAPNQGQIGLTASIARGTLNYVSGLIAKLRPESVSLRTPTAVIGVRGTQFVLRVDPS